MVFVLSKDRDNLQVVHFRCVYQFRHLSQIEKGAQGEIRTLKGFSPCQDQLLKQLVSSRHDLKVALRSEKSGPKTSRREARLKIQGSLLVKIFGSATGAITSRSELTFSPWHIGWKNSGKLRVKMKPIPKNRLHLVRNGFEPLTFRVII